MTSSTTKTVATTQNEIATGTAKPVAARKPNATARKAALAAKTTSKPAAKPAAKTTSKAAAKPAAKPAASKAAAKTTSKPAAKPAAKTTSKAAAKPAAKTTKAAAKSAPVIKIDKLHDHIAEAFADKRKGKLMTVSEIAAAITSVYPKSDERPPATTIGGRIRDERLPQGIMTGADDKGRRVAIKR